MSAASEQRHREAWPMLLNVGCGQTFHSEWINVDVVPASPAVRRVDLARGLPFPDRSIDACYCSHVLEHLRPDDAGRALAELFRVLRPGGVVRIVVPDLRRVAEQYLSAFAAVDRGGLQREADYDWMMMELLDQSVRDTTGGEMARFLRRTDLPNRDFIRSRIGEEAERFWREDDAAQSPGPVRRLRKAWKRLGAIRRRGCGRRRVPRRGLPATGGSAPLDVRSFLARPRLAPGRLHAGCRGVREHQRDSRLCRLLPRHRRAGPGAQAGLSVHGRPAAGGGPAMNAGVQPAARVAGGTR
jgi:predicted SAM-dependent methyltransferase